GDLPYTATVTAREVLPRGDARHVEVTKGSRQPIAVCDLGPVPLLSQLPPELPIHQLGEVPLPLLLQSLHDLLVRPDADRHLSPDTLRNLPVLHHSPHPAVPAPRRRRLSWSTRPLTPLPARTPRATRSTSGHCPQFGFSQEPRCGYPLTRPADRRTGRRGSRAAPPARPAECGHCAPAPPSRARRSTPPRQTAHAWRRPQGSS